VAKGDLYDRLGVRRDASPAAVRRAYLRLAKRLHPDVNPSPEAHDAFLAVKEAYETLSNPLLRREYDERTSGRAPVWTDLPPVRGPARVIRVSSPFAPRRREPRAVRVRPPADDRRRHQLEFAYTAATASLSVLFLGGAFLLVALGGVLPGFVSFVMGLTLVLVLFHVLPSVRFR
jgi:curved DNA-binding protein CbpA